jgi:hypothetical protein
MSAARRCVAIAQVGGQRFGTGAEARGALRRILAARAGGADARSFMRRALSIQRTVASRAPFIDSAVGSTRARIAAARCALRRFRLVPRVSLIRP